MGPVVECVPICIKHHSEQQHIMLGQAQSDTTYGLGVPYTLCREENNVPMDWGHDGRETTGLQEYERSTRWKSEAERSDVQALGTEYSSRMFSVVFSIQESSLGPVIS